MMLSENPYVKIPSKMGEEIRKILLENGLLDTERRIIGERNHLYLPLIDKSAVSQVKALITTEQIEFGSRAFLPVVEGPSTLVDALAGDLTEEQLGLLPRAYDLVGDIAVLEIPEELLPFSELIGDAFLKIHPNFSTVLGKRGAISGTRRVRSYEFLAGEKKTDTIHIEYGCKIRVDLAKAYFSPRLLEEHNQVANQVIDGETVLDMFTGVGPFALHIAKSHVAKVLAVDINPDAIDLLKESLQINKLAGEVVPIHSDVREFIQTQIPKVDRIIMNHPSGAGNYVPDACDAIKGGGILHYYEFIGSENPEDAIKSQVTELIESAGREVGEVSRVRRVRDSAPYEYQMVCDITVL
ncbi:class I SAM-dependent methyltransferase family protein [Candidatus Thorarchaeota archaeon]|nr:MAG: class I SAM-dependent methyltransferase family protein [Candidatus Thorarchaeota archaeon]